MVSWLSYDWELTVAQCLIPAAPAAGVRQAPGRAFRGPGRQLLRLRKDDRLEGFGSLARGLQGSDREHCHFFQRWA